MRLKIKLDFDKYKQCCSNMSRILTLIILSKNVFVMGFFFNYIIIVFNCSVLIAAISKGRVRF